MISENLAVDEILFSELESVVLPIISEYDNDLLYGVQVIGMEYMTHRTYYTVRGSDVLYMLSNGICVQARLLNVIANVSFEVIEVGEDVDDIPF